MYEEAIYFSKAALSFVNVQKLLSHDFRYFRYHYFTICGWLYKNNCSYYRKFNLCPHAVTLFFEKTAGSASDLRPLLKFSY